MDWEESKKERSERGDREGEESWETGRRETGRRRGEAGSTGGEVVVGGQWFRLVTEEAARPTSKPFKLIIHDTPENTETTEYS